MSVGGFELPGDHVLKQIIWDVSLFLLFLLLLGLGGFWFVVLLVFLIF